jgi:hypothetical protein
MIRTEPGLRSTHDAILNLQLALLGLYEKKAKYGKGYPIMAEGIVGEIFKLRKEIDDMIGLTDYVAEFGVPKTDEELDALAAASPLQASMKGTASAADKPTAAIP